MALEALEVNRAASLFLPARICARHNRAGYPHERRLYGLNHKICVRGLHTAVHAQHAVRRKHVILVLH